jgi:hypothetical protein
MKKILICGLVLTGLLSFSLSLYSETENSEKSKTKGISDVEKKHILFMREEEKLARDVYITLGKKWDIWQMKRIQKSEQRHMDALKTLIKKFNLEDPVTDDAVGKFNSEHFKELYDKLVKDGSASLVKALTVGAIIEDLDIKDLDECISECQNKQVISIFKNLNRGSRNHMRAFTRALKSNNSSYAPKYISEKQYKSIITSDQERGGGGGHGHGKGRGRE